MPNKKMDFKGTFKNSRSKIRIGLELVTFIQDDIHVVYAPALDLAGYGNTINEAQESFEIVSGEFLNYTTNKSTLIAELKRLGWNIQKKMYSAPQFSDLLSTNDKLREIVDNYDVSKTTGQVSIPAMA